MRTSLIKRCSQRSFVFTLFLLACLFSVPHSALAANDNTTVYVTNYGTKYHQHTCSYLKSCESVTLRYAVEHGFTRCSVCKPPFPNFEYTVIETRTYPFSHKESSGDSTTSPQDSANDNSVFYFWLFIVVCMILPAGICIFCYIRNDTKNTSSKYNFSVRPRTTYATAAPNKPVHNNLAPKKASPPLTFFRPETSSKFYMRLSFPLPDVGVLSKSEFAFVNGCRYAYIPLTPVCAEFNKVFLRNFSPHYLLMAYYGSLGKYNYSEKNYSIWHSTKDGIIQGCLNRGMSFTKIAALMNYRFGSSYKPEEFYCLFYNYSHYKEQIDEISKKRPAGLSLSFTLTELPQYAQPTSIPLPPLKIADIPEKEPPAPVVIEPEVMNENKWRCPECHATMAPRVKCWRCGAIFEKQ